MTKKTITIDLTFKKWMKIALLAILFFTLSYFFMTTANAQTNSNISTGITATTSISGCAVQFNNSGYLTCSNSAAAKSSDPSFRQVWSALVSFLFLIAAALSTLGAVLIWNNEE